MVHRATPEPGGRRSRPARSAVLPTGRGMDEHASAIDTAAAIRAKEVSPARGPRGHPGPDRRPQPGPQRRDLAQRRRGPGRGARARATASPGAPPTSRRSPACRCPSRICCPWPASPSPTAAPAPPTPRPSESELVATAFVDAGFILCGRTNAPEFGSVSVTENDAVRRHPQPVGHGVHPRAARAAGRPRRWPRACSPAANASDGGGSIRIPASCCGLVGHKPSRGRVADTVPGWSGLAIEGVVTRTVADSAAILEVISLPTRWPGGARPPRSDRSPRRSGPTRAAAGGRQHRLCARGRGGTRRPSPPWTTRPRCSSRSATRSPASTPTCSTRATSATSST